MSKLVDMKLALTPLTLPNGQTLKNRIAKSAMEENMASALHNLSPTPHLIKLYQTWADGGSGLIISGNVMIDYLAVGGVAPISTSRELQNRVQSDASIMKAFRDWTTAGTSNGAQFWLQLNHPGRQAFAPAATKIVAPSASKAVNVGFIGKAFFSAPREMTKEEIFDAIQRFAEGAQFAELIGATGVQVHGAHGYLVSQFLSPLINTREDEWGGSLENRARFLFEVVRAIRKVVSPSFAVSLKLNSADFQRGGFSNDDAEWVVKELNQLHYNSSGGRGGLDLIEISGGNYEATAMAGNVMKLNSRTAAREAYFIDFAHRITSISRIPIMVTGGISSADSIAAVVSPAPGQTNDTVKTIAGIATALALCPDLPNQLARGEDPSPRLTSGPSLFIPKSLDFVASLRQVQYCIRLISQDKPPSFGVSKLRALISDQIYSFSLLRAYKKLVWRVARDDSGGKASL